MTRSNVCHFSIAQRINLRWKHNVYGHLIAIILARQPTGNRNYMNKLKQASFRKILQRVYENVYMI